MAQQAPATEESLLEKLIRTKYPLTNYLHRQQQFLKMFPSTTNPLGSEPTKSISKGRMIPSKASFNVPDTLDPFASEYEQHSHEQDETMLSNLSHCIPESQCISLRSSSIPVEFSPMDSETNSPLQRAIENSLNLLNKREH